MTTFFPQPEGEVGSEGTIDDISRLGSVGGILMFSHIQGISEFAYVS